MAFLPVIELSSLDGDIGFAMVGPNGTATGWAVGAAGDVNDDGIGDLIVGAQLGAGNAGESYVVFGRTDFAPSIDLTGLDGGDGFAIVGASAGDRSGWSVAAAGDVNDDGIDDLIVGARDASPNAAAGAAYVIYGRSTAFDATFDLDSLAASAGFAILGPTANSDAGRSVSGAGDVNGDTIDDVIVAVPGAGAAYVVFGRDGGYPGAVNLAALGTAGLVLSGAGYAVSGAGDVNGDLIDDMIVGSPGADTGAGRTYVVFGGAGIGGTIVLTALAATQGFVLVGGSASDDSGYSVGGAGDVNGDGFADVIVGAPDADRNGNNSGAAYVVFGRSSGFAPEIHLTALNGSDGFLVEGIAGGDGAGGAVSGAGDIDHDGIDDIVIGAPLAFPGDRITAGQTYVVFGHTGAFPAKIEASALDGADGFVVNGACGGVDDFYGDRSGFAVGGAGDVNGDGIDDVVIGAPFADVRAAFVVFGRSTDVTPPDTTIVSGPDGPTSDNTPAFDFASDDSVATYERSLDGSSFVAASDPLTFTILPDGVHTLAVRARDAAGNADPSPDLRTFTIDTTAPDTTIVSGPNGLIADNDPVFDFGSNESGVTFEAALDGGSYVAVGDPLTFADLGDGVHTLSVRARDAVDNVDASPASRTFTIDTAAPDTTILSGPVGTIADDDPVFDFGSNEGGVTYEASLDGSAYVAVGDPLTLTGLADGSHTLAVRARDAAGNVDPTPATRVFAIDTTLPAAAAITAFADDTGTTGDGITTDRTLTVSGTAEPLSTVHVFRDGVEIGTAPAAGDGTWSFADPAIQSLGTHRYKARAEDAADQLGPFSPDLEVLVADPAAAPTNGPDVLLGSAAANQIQGGEGNDTIAGEAGNDTLKGNNGNDLLLGGEGADRLDGENGADTARGGNGNDTLYGQNGNDRLLGEGGNDRLEGGTGLDSIDGGAGNDTLYGGVDTDSLFGDAGADQLYGDADGDWLAPGSDLVRDTVFGTIAHLQGDTIDGFVDGMPTVPGADMVFVTAMTNAQRAQIDGDILDAQGRLFLPGGGSITFLGHGGAEVDAVNAAGGVQIWLV